MVDPVALPWRNMTTIMDVADTLLGLGAEAKDLSWGEMIARACLVYVVTLVIVRLGKKRFMARATAFDVIVGIVLGSIVSRAITGNAPLLPALCAAAMIMALHWLFSWLALQSAAFGKLIKGDSIVVVRDGQVDERAMRHCHLTRHDLMEELRAKSVEDLSGIKEARLERNGAISVIKSDDPPRIVEISVEEGVKSVRLQIG